MNREIAQKTAGLDRILEIEMIILLNIEIKR